MGNNASGYSSSTTAENVFEINQNRNLKGKIAIVTGCSNGVGLETARSLFWHGCHVVMACRNEKTMQKAEQDIKTNPPASRKKTTTTTTENEQNNNNSDVGEITCLVVDLTSQKSVKQFVSDFEKKFDRVHYLVLNAGAIIGEKGTTEDGFETTMATNHFGHFTMTLQLLKSLVRAGSEKKSESGEDQTSASENARVVVVSSEAHKLASKNGLDLSDINFKKRDYGLQGFTAYGHSKYANVLFSLELNRLFVENKLPIRSYSLHPGFVNSNFGANLSSIAKTLMASGASLFGKNNEQGAATSIYCCIAPELEGKGGTYYSDCHECEAQGADLQRAKDFWKLSEELTGVKFQIEDPASSST